MEKIKAYLNLWYWFGKVPNLLADVPPKVESQTAVWEEVVDEINDIIYTGIWFSMEISIHVKQKINKLTCDIYKIIYIQTI